jgi:hypothetical protein
MELLLRKGKGIVRTAIRIGREVKNKKITGLDKFCGWEPGRKVFPIVDVLTSDPFFLNTWHVSQRRVRAGELRVARNWIRKGLFG